MQNSRVVIAIAALFAADVAFASEGDTNAPTAAFPVSIHVDASKSLGELHPIWRFFGADEPNYAYMQDGRKLISELGKLRPTGSVYFRAHNLLTSGDGTPAFKWGSTGAYREDTNGHAQYDWTIVDRIFNTYLEQGVRPYVEIGFMPKELSIHPEPYQHHFSPTSRYGTIFTGWSYPPNDYAKWGELVYQWAKHEVETHGRAEVEAWYWEVWNEANIGYWHGTREEFFRLHDVAVDAVRRALPTAKVGGPDSAGGGEYLTSFLEHCVRGTNAVTGKIGTPIDFISFHAKGAPSYTNDHVRMGIAAQLRGIDDSFRRIAQFPELKEKPIVIGESDPDGCAACQNAQYGYRNTLMYASYTACSFGHESDLAAKHGVNLEGALTWAFEFEDQPLFAGFRVLASGGIDLPVLNVFRMLNLMGGQRVSAESDHAVALDSLVRAGVRDQPDVAALASLDRNRLCVMVWHYHDDDVPGPDAAVSLDLAGLPPAAAQGQVRHYRIDKDHSDAYTVWQGMGSPPKPDAGQYAQLEAAGKLAELGKPQTVSIKDGKATLNFALPREAVSLLVLDW